MEAEEAVARCLVRLRTFAPIVKDLDVKAILCPVQPDGCLGVCAHVFRHVREGFLHHTEGSMTDARIQWPWISAGGDLHVDASRPDRGDQRFQIVEAVEPFDS